MREGQGVRGDRRGGLVRRMSALALVVCCAGVIAAGTAQANQPVTVDFTAHGTAIFNGQMTPSPCNGAAIYATVTDALPFSWETKFNTTINNDETIIEEPGYLVSHDFGTQSANVVGSGGDGGSGCNQAVAMSIQSCPTPVQSDVTSDTPPAIRDPDRSASQPGAASYENVDVQGPLHLGNDNPLATGVSIGCGLAFNDVSMLNASLPDMFVAHIQLPHNLFYDPSTGKTRESWSTDVSMPATSPVDGSSCAAGNNGVAYIYCSKNVRWSGTVTVTPRADDCTEGATAPPSAPCPPAKPVVPYATVMSVTGPSGNAATTGGAAARGEIPVSISVSGAGTISGSLTSTAVTQPSGSSRGAHEAAAKRTVIASGRVVARKAGRVMLKLKLTKAGRTLLRSWKKHALSTALLITVTDKRGQKTTATRTIKLRRTATRDASGNPKKKA
jgi:hypothetical protein